MSIPEWINVLDVMASSVGGSKNLICLNGRELIESAKKLTNLEDFADENWESRVEEYLNKTNGYFLYNTAELIFLRAEALRNLVNRLLLVNELKNSNDILSERIEKPIFIIGNARTGTSILFELLSQDSAFRSPRYCDYVFPIPLFIEDMSHSESRKEITQKILDFLTEIRPGIDTVHRVRWDTPIECNEFTRVHFELDMGNIYPWHKRMLQTLQFGNSAKTWLLKSVKHISFLDRILQMYPNAHFIHTHRDMAKVIPSTVSAHNSVFGRRAIPDALFLKIVCERAIESFRKVIREREANIVLGNRITDVRYADLMKSPVDTIKRCYEHFELEFSQSLESRIVLYLKENSQHKYGVHRYSCENFGSSDKKIRDKFLFYTDYYGIPFE